MPEQKQDRWVTVEKDPKGDLTGCITLNLKDVRIVIVDRASETEPLTVQVGLDGPVHQIIFSGYSGPIFLKYWNDYNPVPAEFVAPQAEPSKILGVRTHKGKGQIQPSSLRV